MKLFNTQSQQIEPFLLLGDAVTLHICDLIPQDRTHLGVAFRYSVADVLLRYLVMKGWRVKFVLNIADQNDDMSKKGQDSSQKESRKQCTRRFIEDMQALNVYSPDFFPQVSEMMPQMVASLQMLQAGKIAYTVTGNVLFQVEADNLKQPFMRVWLPLAPVNQNGKRMAASRENRVMVPDLLQRYSADVIRVYLANHHYRRPWEHNEVKLEKAAQYVEKFKAALTAVSSGKRPINVTPAQKRFTAAMDNDLDTRKAIATLLNLADEILFRADNGYRIDQAQGAFQQMSSVFGLRLLSNGNDSHINNGWHKLNQRFEVLNQQ